MKINLLQVSVAMIMILIIMYMMKTEPRLRTVPNIDFTLNRQLNKSNPRKQEMMHIFSNMEVPGWKWDKLYA
jgi:hypothetical protein